MAVVMLLLRVAHHSGNLSLYHLMSLQYLLHHIPHDAALPQVEMRREAQNGQLLHICYTHPSGNL
jgi:hypothetical protein